MKKHDNGRISFDRIRMIPTDHNIWDYIDESKSDDVYTSIYKYSQEHFEKFKKTKSVAGIRDISTSRMVFDFDSEDNIEQARKDTAEVCSRLIHKGIDAKNIQVYFSGKKGFGVEVLMEENVTRKQFENLVNNLAGDLSTFDPKIKDQQRIMRVPMTKHPDTGLYKLPLTVNQVSETPIETIKELAKSLDSFDEAIMDKWIPIKLPKPIEELKALSANPEAKIEVSLEDLKFDPEQLDFDKRPPFLNKERYALSEGFYEQGERNEALLILAATYKHQGFNKEITYNMLKATSRLQAARTGGKNYPKSKIWNEVVEHVYGENYQGGLYSSDNELLVKTRKIFKIDNSIEDSKRLIISNKQMFSDFKHFATNYDKNTIELGLPIDEDVRIMTGMPVALLGAPSSGKTTVLLNALKNTSERGIKSLFFSLDMHRALVCQKQIQMLYGNKYKTDEEIYKAASDKKIASEMRDSLEKSFGNVDYVTRSGLTIEEIRREVEIKKNEVGEELKLVAVDYLECIRGPYSDPTTNTLIVSDGIKNIATDLDVCVLLLVQPPKTVGGAAYPLTNMYQIKGSSMVAQAMRVVVGIYREGFSPDTIEQDKYVTFVGLKNSMGSLFKKDCRWDGRTGSIRKLTANEEENLDDLRKELEQKRSKENF